MAVYFAQSADGETIKIGSSFDPIGRVRQLRFNGQKFTLIRSEPGGLAAERWYQLHFRPYLVRGKRDFFRFVPDMLTVAAPEGLDPREHSREEGEKRKRWRLEDERALAAKKLDLPLIEALCDVSPGTFDYVFAPVPPRWTYGRRPMLVQVLLRSEAA